MTTTVMIAVQGNKEVSIETPTGRMVLPPGKWVHGLQIHGEQSLKIAETGGFVDAGPGWSKDRGCPPVGTRLYAEKLHPAANDTTFAVPSPKADHAPPDAD